MKFEVYTDGQPAKDFTLTGAYMFGADTIPLHNAGRIKVSGGLIECKRKSNDSAGLALLWPINGSGRFLLPTTRLPDRKKPYILNVELARARLMQITLKREDWTFFEESSDFAEMAEEAKTLFIEALQNTSDPGKASLLADESLKKAIEFSEKLAATHAETLFTQRCGSKSLSRHSLGCRVDAEMLGNEQYSKWLFDMFGFVTIPINWAQIEPQRGQFDFSSVDKCIEGLSGKRLAICAGPLLRFTPDYLPNWLKKGKLEFEKIREAAYGFVSRTVGRYSKYIHAWQVISGMNAENHFGFNFEQVIEMTRTACLSARSVDPKSRKIVEILYPWGEYYAHDRNTVPALVYTDTLIQTGITFDAFGVQLHFGKDKPGLHMRDLMQISSRLDCFAAVSKPLHITGVAIPDCSGSGKQDCNVAGSWQKVWDQDVQAEWLDNIYRIAIGKGFINSITYSNLADGEDMDISDSGLLNKQLVPKKALLTLARIQKTILNK